MDDLYIFEDFDPFETKSTLLGDWCPEYNTVEEQLEELELIAHTSPDDTIKYPNLYVIFQEIADVFYRGNPGWQERNRSLEEIAKILFDIHNYFDHRNASRNAEQGYKSWFVGYANKFDPTPYSINCTLAYSLIPEMSYERESPSHISNIKNIEWVECFAALGIGIYSDSLRYEKYAKEEGKSNEEILLALCTENLIALSKVEFITSVLIDGNWDVFSDILSDYNQQRLSRSAGKKGGEAKASQQAALKEKVFKLRSEKYPNGQYSAPKAATLIVENDLSEKDYIGPNGRRVIVPFQEITRIERWIRANDKNDVSKISL